MTTTSYVVWLVFVAVATITILIVGTLAPADLLPRPMSRQAERSDLTRPGPAHSTLPRGSEQVTS